jgi:hypothetical protein
VTASGSRRFQVDELGNGVVRIDLKKGESVVLYPGATPPDALAIGPVALPTAGNYWGTKAP